MMKTCTGGGFVAALFAMAVALGACSSDNEPAGTGSSSSGTSGSGSAEIGKCSTFVDRTGATADRKVPWDLSVTSKDARCMQIKVGQKVTWSKPDLSGAADFASHPLETNGGDSPSPISAYDKTTGEVTFTKAGTYGFVCGAHSTMQGAIQVN
jgi:plastocyanin